MKDTDVGKYIRVRVKHSGHTDKWLDSAAVGPVPDPSLPTLQGKVTITGTAKIGATLTAEVSGLSNGATAIYQWQNGTGTTFVDIAGAAGETYVIQNSDIGKKIKVAVSSQGFNSIIYSEPTGTVLDPNSVAGRLETLSAMETLPPTYTITVSADERIEPQDLYFEDADWEPIEIEITLKGASSSNNTLTLTEEGAMFKVNEGVTLILEDVVLIGISDNTYPLIDIWAGTLIMNDGAVIKNNTNLDERKYFSGGGVYNFMGTFTMNGGTITGNTSKFGGGVFIDEGYFTMNGGEITNNTAESEGGGVYNEIGYSGEGYFEMKDGTISGNKAGYGGGVSNNGEFSMVDGTISGNTSEVEGGGVFNDSYAKFTMNYGTISGNKSKYGGGVSNWYDFSMEDGTISGNTSEYEGGGVHNEGYFFMYDGKISGNKSNYGGGVTNWSIFAMLDGEISANEAIATDGGGGGVDNYDVYGDGCTFYMEGGIIHGSNADENLRNKSVSGFDSLSNYALAYHGVFFVEDDDDLEIKGSLPSANLTIKVASGVLLEEIASRSITVTGIEADYHGMTAVLADEIDLGPWGTFWFAFSNPVEVSGSTKFTFLTPVLPQLADIRLYILDIPLEDFDSDDFSWDNYYDDQIIIYTGKINLELGDTPVAITEFSEVGVTTITITDLPENIDEDWDMFIFDRDVDGYGEDSGSWYDPPVGYIAFFGEIGYLQGPTARCPDELDIEGEYNLSMQFRHYYTGVVYEEYFFTTEIISGIENIVSFNDMVKQTISPRIVPPSMKIAPRTERTVSSARSSVSFNDIRQATTAAPAREMKQKQKVSANLYRPFPNLITIQDMMKGVRVKERQSVQRKTLDLQRLRLPRR